MTPSLADLLVFTKLETRRGNRLRVPAYRSPTSWVIIEISAR